MKNILLALLLAFPTLLFAQETACSTNDSLFVETILQKHAHAEYNGKLVMDIAEEFLGRKYTAGTLDNGSKERLIIDTGNVDCTTFVETVVAIATTIKEGGNFAVFCNNLQKLRYKGGIIDGYASRLHYITQWASDAREKGILTEVTRCALSRNAVLNLCYMSSNPEKYPRLKGNAALQRKIEESEKPFRGIEVPYIPKEHLLNNSASLPIADGDILALTTDIQGLDVLHVGFAFWKDGKLHLLHASSGEGRVIKESRTLFDYLKNKKRHTGARVFRLQ